jgi:hypothetical protein
MARPGRGWPCDGKTAIDGFECERQAPGGRHALLIDRDD